VGRTTTIPKNSWNGQKKKTPVEEDWKELKYCIFDVPFHPGPYEERLEWLHDNIKGLSDEVLVIGGRPCKGFDDLTKEVDNVVDVLEGEGIMLRKPGSFYEHKRSYTLLKVKKFGDEEALVIGWKSDHVLLCQLPSGATFGLTIPQSTRPKRGEIVTFKFQELTQNGIPRFPGFLRIRKDVTWQEVCQNAKAKETERKPTKEPNQPVLFGTPEESIKVPASLMEENSPASSTLLPLITDPSSNVPL